MEKMIWSKPEMNEFAFAANEYVASSCGGGTNYLFKCDAGGGAPGEVWLETNGVDNCQTESKWNQTGPNPWDGEFEYHADRYLGGYHACGREHETKNQNEFLNGWYRKNGTTEFIKVLVWRGGSGLNTHCTTNLNINTWDRVPS